nr:unnamed protein product [Callosobruchus chinensis]
MWSICWEKKLFCGSPKGWKIKGIFFFLTTFSIHIPYKSCSKKKDYTHVVQSMQIENSFQKTC